MSGALTPPSTDEMIAFLRARFGPLIKHEGVSKNNHYVFQIEGRHEDSSVPLDRKHIGERTLHNILQCAGITVKEYRALAGTPGQLKAYVKDKRREAQAGE